MTHFKCLLFLVLALVSSCCNHNVAQKGTDLVSEFKKLSQDEKRKILPFMLDSLEHDMYGLGVSKSKNDLQNSGGLPGYYINHYPTYTSGGLLVPVLRIYDYKNKLIDSLIGGTITPDGKTLRNIGGFSKPFDFARVRINGSISDPIDEKIRANIMKGEINVDGASLNEINYSKEFMNSLKNSDFIKIQDHQNLLTGAGYDTDCVATTLRETFEETGMMLRQDALILLGLHGRAIDQKTMSGYTIKTATTSVCTFMIEMGDIYLDKNGKVNRISINKASVINHEKIEKKINKETIVMNGSDDAEFGIGFGKLSTLKKSKSADYTVVDIQGKKFNYPITIGISAQIIPPTTRYNTCRTFELSSFATTEKATTIVDKKIIRTLCHLKEQLLL